jgi:hypothetical protein
MEATKARIEAHPGRKHQARRFQLLSLEIKVAQIRAMEQELLRFLGASRQGMVMRRAASSVRAITRHSR